MHDVAVALPKGLSAWAQLRETEHAGRSLFAAKQLDKATLVLGTKSPFCSVVLYDFRKEVCAGCFFYDGATLETRLRREKEHTILKWFCSENCRDEWTHEMGDVGIQAISAVEDMIRAAKSKANGKAEDVAIKEGTVSIEEVKAAYEEAQKMLNQRCNTSKNAKERQKHKLPTPLTAEDDPDTIRFLFDAIIRRYNDAINNQGQHWTLLCALAPSFSPYISNNGRALLESHIRILCNLAATLPMELRPYATADTVLTVVTRDSGNSFGIWDELNSKTIENERNYMLGYALYPEASFFNHSCEPNMTKRRVGQMWLFETMRAIEKDEELCITYLGGDETKPLEERRGRLLSGWHFVCACAKCRRECETC